MDDDERWEEERIDKARQKAKDLEMWKKIGERTLAAKQRIVGSDTDMFINASSILDKPGGRRERARRAVFKGKADVTKIESLCNDLKDSMYRDELYALAKELDLPVLKSATKSELCDAIATYTAAATNVVQPIKSVYSNKIPYHLMYVIHDLEIDRDSLDNLTISQELFNRLDTLVQPRPQRYNREDELIEFNDEDLAHFLRYEIEDIISKAVRVPSFLYGSDTCGDCVSESIRDIMPSILRAYKEDGGKNPLVLSFSTADQ